MKEFMSVLAAAIIGCSMLSPAAGAQSVYLSKSEVDLSVGESTDIDLVGSFNRSKWKVSDGNVFSYQNGKITAVGEGTAELTVTCGGKTYTCVVNVNGGKASSSRSSRNRKYVVSDEVSLKKGEVKTLDIPSDTVDVTIRTDNANAVGLECGLWNGETFALKVKGRAYGTANVTVIKNNSGKVLRTIRVKVGNTSSDDNNVYVSSEDYTSEVIRLVNEERAKYGLDPLSEDESLAECAQTRAEEVSVRFSHTRPNGQKGLDIIDIPYFTRAENIAQGQASPQAVVDSWMSSGGHRSNILNSRFVYIGVGYDESTDSWVQLFVG